MDLNKILVIKQICKIMRNYAKLCEIMQNDAKLCKIMQNYAKLREIMQKMRFKFKKILNQTKKVDQIKNN